MSPSSSGGNGSSGANGSWKPVDVGWAQTGARLHAIAFADAQHGLAAGWMPQPTAASAAHVSATSDGGATWTQAALAAQGQGAPYTSICSPVPGKAWGVGDLGFIAVSTDSGATWRYQHRMTMGLDLTCVWFVDANNGWAVGSQLHPTMTPATYTAVVLHTADGGTTWKEQPVGPLAQKGATLLAVRFSDAQNGWAVGAVAAEPKSNPLGGQGIALSTTDGGKTWAEHQMPGATKILVAVATTDAQHAWAVSGSGTVAYTSDGGATWSQSSTGGPPVAGSLWAIAFQDAENGWLGGRDLLLRTADGGKTWAPTMSGTFDVYALCILSDGSAWAAGDVRKGSTPQPAVWSSSPR